jgi:hypothetical protein
VERCPRGAHRHRDERFVPPRLVPRPPRAGDLEALGHDALPWANELKLVWPDYDPADWAGFPADHRFISPRADRTIRDEVVEQDAAVWVSEQFGWRLSLQTHKITRMR